MNTEEPQEIWQVEANGHVFETHFAEMTEWIADGSLLRIDRVRKANLRWIEAGKVPSLLAVFNAKDNGELAPPPTVTTIQGEPSPATSTTPVSNAASDSLDCVMHAGVSAAFACSICNNHFCKACPNSYGGTVKICPFCGAMCTSVPATAEPVPSDVYYPPTGKFGFGDFFEALAYPFKFKTGLILGAIMFAFLSIGQVAGSVGGLFMAGASITCFMLANTLTFGVLANTVENFAQGKIGLNFMPSFDDFSIWDDVVHPFFLMIGVYISSFGPLIAVALVAFFLVIAPATAELTDVRPEPADTLAREMPYTANAARQSQQVRELIDRTKQQQSDRIAAIESESESHDTGLGPAPTPDAAAIEEAQIQEVQALIDESRRAQVESIVGKTPETEASERTALFKQLLGYGVALLIVGGLALLWGLFYFPAACTVAAYTRSFAAAVNPSVGIDTIRRLGVDYLKILVMGALLAVASGVVGGVLAVIFSPFDMPRVGNIPASIVNSLFAFYLSVVFSCVIGFALYKSAEKLKLYR